jgi:hypothetical protein
VVHRRPPGSRCGRHSPARFCDLTLDSGVDGRARQPRDLELLFAEALPPVDVVRPNGIEPEKRQSQRGSGNEQREHPPPRLPRQ